MSQIGLLGAFLGGLLALLSPCSALLLPSFFAYAFDGAGKLAGRTGIFYLGLAAVLVPLGAGVGAIGSAITRYREVTTMIGGVVIIALGVMIIVGRGFALGSAQRAAARIDVSSTGSVFALGAVYGLAGFCSGPLLGAVLTVAVAGGQAAYGGVLMALYAAGMVIPLFVLALVWDRFSLGSRTWLRGKEISIGPLKTHTTSLISGGTFHRYRSAVPAHGGHSEPRRRHGGRQSVLAAGLDQRCGRRGTEHRSTTDRSADDHRSPDGAHRPWSRP